MIATFLFVNKIKMIGMLLNVKSTTKIYKKEFDGLHNHSTLLPIVLTIIFWGFKSLVNGVN